MNEIPVQYDTQATERPVTFTEWLKLVCIFLFSLIPLVGWLVTLILFIVKATDQRLPESMRNAVKAGFIFYGILLAVSILVLILFFGIVGEALYSSGFFDELPYMFQQML